MVTLMTVALSRDPRLSATLNPMEPDPVSAIAPKDLLIFGPICADELCRCVPVTRKDPLLCEGGEVRTCCCTTTLGSGAHGVDTEDPLCDGSGDLQDCTDSGGGEVEGFR